MDSNPPSRRSMPAIEMQRHSSLFPPRRGSQGPSHPRGKRNIAIPSIGQLAAHDLLKRFGQFWKCSGVRREFVSPLRFGQLSPLDRLAKVFARPLGDIKWRLRRPASFCFVSRTSSAPSRDPCDSKLFSLAFNACLKLAYGIHRTHDLRYSHLGRRPGQRNRARTRSPRST
jgi:hypothetical protein